jgi:heme exporter protein C
MMRSMSSRLLQITTLLGIAVALYMAFVFAPVEQKMGVIQKIFYFHVPSAFMAFLGVGLCAVMSVLYLLTRERRWDLVAHASAELGVVFCSIVLITGPIWARPVWGVWWTGEVRLTSTLILWLIYVGYLLLRQNAENREQAARWAAITGIVGALDMPIIYKSVEWWRGLHPKVLKISGGGGLDPEMGRAFAVCMVAFALLFVCLLVERVRLGRLQDEIEWLDQQIARRPPATGAAAGGGASR